jgi:hypothetical protein
VRVGGQDDHALHSEHVARDLRLDGDRPLAHLARSGVDLDLGLAAGPQRHPHAGGGVVVEAAGEADVLEADGVAHPAPNALAVRGVRDAAGELAQVGRAAVGQGRERHGRELLEQVMDRSRSVDGLP